MLGQEHELKQGILLSLLNTTAIPWVNGLFGVGLGLVSLMLYLAQRDRREYLWIFLYTLVVLNSMSWRTFTLTHNIPMAWLTLGILVYTPMLILLFVLYFAFLRLRMGRWIWISLGAAITLQTAGFYGLYILHLTTQALLLVVQLPVNILTTVVLPVLLIVQWRKGNREAGILLIPALFSSVATYVSVGFSILMLFPGTFAFGDRMFLLIFSFQVGPFTVSLYDVGDFLFNLSLTVIVVLRATKASREQALFEGELAAARGVQQVIVPEHVESIPGFTVESAYLPAQQVGGDFFQVLPVKDGGLLVVVGDVAGKGLPAAMLVSVMVGAIRGVAAFTTDPAELLANLNDRLVGRVQGGFATALVARIDPDGRIAIANAGHPSPYLNGMELELTGALPLGIESGARYVVFHSSIPPGARLTFYSDGVIEAMDGKGEMFGFERAQAISTERAGAILERTVGFGQQDDITVITIDRMPAIAAAA